MRVCTAIHRNATRREHRTLHAVVHDRERAVDDPAVRVHRHAGREVEVFGVAVEPEPVVVIRIAADGMRDRQRGLMDRVVVERREHAVNARSLRRNRRTSSSITVRCVGRFACECPQR